jgi:glycosyltransferase involved in cell wall biosynthesis
VKHLSVIVPTRDRPELLRDTLMTLAEQDISPDAFEVIVVDDGSEPPLEPIVRDAAGAKQMRCERQPPGGLNAGRNRGASAATGDVLAYLDDDVLVPPTWARSLLEGFERLGCDAIAGRIRLRLGAESPRWLSSKLRRYLSELDLGDEPTWLRPDQDPYGANCAVTREAFERVGGFGDALDREGASLRSNGDVEFFRRLRGAGGQIAYWPSACVEHRVPAERLTAEWFRRRAFAQGHSDMLLLPPSSGAGHAATRSARELARFGRTAPILARNLALGRGAMGAWIWASYCRGRLSTLRDAQRAARPG